MFAPMLGDGWIALQKLVARGFTHRIKGAREVHALRTQIQLERRKERCIGQKVENEQEPQSPNPQKRQWIAPDNNQTTEESHFFGYRHRPGTIFPQLR